MPTGDEILAWKKQVEERELEERTECPVCGWTLDKHPKTGILHCPLGHWNSGGLSESIRRLSFD